MSSLTLDDAAFVAALAAARRRVAAMNGVRCPACGGRLATIRITHPAPNVTARRRLCGGCGHRLTTHERPARVK